MNVYLNIKYIQLSHALNHNSGKNINMYNFQTLLNEKMAHFLLPFAY